MRDSLQSINLPPGNEFSSIKHLKSIGLQFTQKMTIARNQITDIQLFGKRPNKSIRFFGQTQICVFIDQMARDRLINHKSKVIRLKQTIKTAYLLRHIQITGNFLSH